VTTGQATAQDIPARAKRVKVPRFQNTLKAPPPQDVDEVRGRLNGLPLNMQRQIDNLNLNTQADIRLCLAIIIKGAVKGRITLKEATGYGWLLEQCSKMVERVAIEQANGIGADGKPAGQAGFQGFKVLPPRVANDPNDPADAAIERAIIDVQPTQDKLP
jgi:hypothetical protein